MINQSPRPAPLWLENNDLAERSRGAAPSVAWGWLQRALRSGEAAIKLEKAGYASEAAPLLRSSLEHAIRLVWANSVGDRFIEVAMLSKQDTSDKLIKAQKNGWKFDPDIVEKLESYINGVSDESKKLGTLTRLKHAVEGTAEDTGSLYMAWLAYTALSHPTFETANPYIHMRDDGHHMALLSTAKPVEESTCAASGIFALIAAVHGYSRLTDLDYFFTPQIEAIMRRHAKYFEGSSTLQEQD
ncbi:DUF5677 domain-containing protein [Nesterenkonia populi]|uniref:DUF5677 domain-containing protein n=1 Tax=Nesterenkonia populi TaxID=1591087 RepID=UPI0011BE5FB0|nr:DUF5677 domain-containing protein [Nesterenkonia populi]